MAHNAYIGRFISEDSYWGEDSNPLSLNLYTYAHNDPIRYTDPTGHIVTDWDKANLTSSQIAAVSKATDDWFAARARGDAKAEADAHAAADAARSTARTSTGTVGSAEGYTFIATPTSSSSSSSSGSSSSSSGTKTSYDTNSGVTYTFVNAGDAEHYSKNVNTIGTLSVVSSGGGEVLTQKDIVNNLLKGMGIDGNKSVTINGKAYSYSDLLTEKPDLVVNGWDPNQKVNLLQDIYKAMGFDMPSGKYAGIYDNWDTITATRSLMALNGLGWEGASGGKTSAMKGDNWDKALISTLELFSSLDEQGKAELRAFLGDMQGFQKIKADKWEAEAARREAEDIEKVNAMKAAQQNAGVQTAANLGRFDARDMAAAGNLTLGRRTPVYTDNSVMRQMTPEEEVKWAQSKLVQYVPVASTINNIVVAASGSDLYGYQKTAGDQKEAKASLVFDVGFALMGGAGGAIEETASTLSNAFPKNGRFATVMPRKFAEQLAKGEGKLSGGAEAWITAADDLAGINTVEGAAKRLTLIDEAGNLRLQGDAVVEFEFKDMSGIASPYNRSNPGFVSGGKTGGDAREWLMPSDAQITNVKIRYLEK